MKKNDIFTFITPKDTTVKAVVVAIIGGHEDTWSSYTHYLCYAERQLFKYTERTSMGEDGLETSFAGYSLIAEYAILPDYDSLLAEQDIQD